MRRHQGTVRSEGQLVSTKKYLGELNHSSLELVHRDGASLSLAGMVARLLLHGKKRNEGVQHAWNNPQRREQSDVQNLRNLRVRVSVSLTLSLSNPSPPSPSACVCLICAW